MIDYGSTFECEASEGKLKQKMSPRERIEKIWGGGAPVPLGGQGHALPDISELVWRPIGEPESENWILAPAGNDFEHERDIVVRKGDAGNVIVYGHGSRSVGKHVLWGNSNTVVFGEQNPEALRVNIYVDGSETVSFFGARSTCNGCSVFVQGNRTLVSIGEDCMFSHGIVIRTSDDHSIVDIDSGSWINPIESIRIDPYVWLCPEVHVLRGVRVGFGSIIGERSLVTTDVGSCVLAVGVPARAIRERVSWDRSAKPSEGIHKQILMRRTLLDK